MKVIPDTDQRRRRMERHKSLLLLGDDGARSDSPPVASIENEREAENGDRQWQRPLASSSSPGDGGGKTTTDIVAPEEWGRKSSMAAEFGQVDWYERDVKSLVLDGKDNRNKDGEGRGEEIATSMKGGDDFQDQRLPQYAYPIMMGGVMTQNNMMYPMVPYHAKHNRMDGVGVVSSSLPHNVGDGASSGERKVSSDYSTIASDTSSMNFASGACEYLANSVLDTFGMIGRGAVAVMDYTEKELCAPAVEKWNAHTELLEKVDRLNALLLKEKEREEKRNRYNPFKHRASDGGGSGGGNDHNKSASSDHGNNACNTGLMCGDVNDVVRSRLFFRNILLFRGNKRDKNINDDNAMGGGKKGGAVINQKKEKSSTANATSRADVVDGGGSTRKVTKSSKSRSSLGRSRSLDVLRKIIPQKSRQQKKHEVDVGDGSRRTTRYLAMTTGTGDTSRTMEGIIHPSSPQVMSTEQCGMSGDARMQQELTTPGTHGGIQIKLSIVAKEEPATRDTNDDVALVSNIESKKGGDVVEGSSTTNLFPKNQYILDPNLGGALSHEIDRVLHESVEMEVSYNSMREGGNSFIHQGDSLACEVLSSPVSVTASLESPSCAWCGMSGGNSAKALEKLKLCSACQSTYYCSTQCQSKDWINGHAETCRAASIMNA